MLFVHLSLGCHRYRTLNGTQSFQILQLNPCDQFYFASGNVRSAYLSSFVWIVKDWSTRAWTYYNNAVSISI